MLRLLPWPSAIGGDKIMSEEVKMLAPCAGVNALLPKLKRKRSDSLAPDAPAPVKLRLDNPTACSQPPPTVAPSTDSVAAPTSSTVASACPPAQAASDIDVNHVRDTITAQLGLEVLLKHNELRLIDQEIARCQIALEQLRRCAEIPYPGSAVAGLSPDVSAGIGASVLPPGRGLPPVSPAPWGVTEGPYTRHYARWLLQDPRFDGGANTPGLLAGGAAQTEGRSTRGNPQDFSALAGKAPRGSRNSMGTNAIHHGGSIHKEKPGPMLIRRKADKVLVKLVCLDCEREDFSSTQGFINHCRIAHNRNYASHDAAAVACGKPVDLDDQGAVVCDVKAAVPEKKKTEDLVHHLIRAPRPAPLEKNLSSRYSGSPTPRKPQFSSSAFATPASLLRPPEQRRQSEPTRVNASFLPSLAAPHLSALVRDRGLGLNMNELVEEAKTPVDLTGLSDDESGDETKHTPADGCPSSVENAVPGVRHPMRIPTAQAGPEGRKGLQGRRISPETTPSRPRPSEPSLLTELALTGPSANSTTDAPRHGDGVDHSSHLSPSHLSPHTNQAPSLVSDYEDDYGAIYDSDGPSSSEDGDEDEDFRHIQVQDDERTTTPATTTEPKPAPTTPPPRSATPLSKPLMQARTNNLAMMSPFNDQGADDKNVNLIPRKEDDTDTKPDNSDGNNPSSP